MTPPATTPSPSAAELPALSAMPRAVAWMGLALLSFSAIAIAGREAGRMLPTSELIFWRSLIGIAVIGAIYARQGPAAAGPRTRVLPQHALRALVHYGAQWAWLQALTLIALAELFALEFTSPLWVAIAAPFVLGERLTGWRMAAAALGFLGAVVVVEPGILTGHLQLTASTGTLLALTAAVGFAAAMIMTKRLTRVEPALRILFWMQVLQAIIAALLLVIGGVRNGHWPLVAGLGTEPRMWGWIAVLGIAGLGAHFGQARAFALVDAMIVAPLDFLRLPLIASVGALVYGEVLSPGLAIGGAIVVAANCINIFAERRAKLSAGRNGA